MTPEEQTIIDKAVSKQAAIKTTIAAKKPQARYLISVVATFDDAAGQDPAELKEVAEAYLAQCRLDVIKCSIIETEVLP